MDTQNTNPDLSHVSLTPNNGPNYELSAQWSVSQLNYYSSAHYTVPQPYNPLAQYTVPQPYNQSAQYTELVSYNPLAQYTELVSYNPLAQYTVPQPYNQSDQHDASLPDDIFGACGEDQEFLSWEDLELGQAPTANNDTQEPSAHYTVPPPYNQSDQHGASLPDGINNLLEELLELDQAPTANNDTQEPSAQYTVPTPPSCYSIDKYVEEQEFLNAEELVDGCHVSTDFNVFDRSSTANNDTQEPSAQHIVQPQPCNPSGAPDGLPTALNDTELMPLPDKLNKDQVVICIKTLFMPLFLLYRKMLTEQPVPMDILREKYDQFIKIINEGWELFSNRKELASFYNAFRKVIIDDTKMLISKADRIDKERKKGETIEGETIKEDNHEISQGYLEEQLNVGYRDTISATCKDRNCSRDEEGLLVELYECFGAPYKTRRRDISRYVRSPTQSYHPEQALRAIQNAKAEAEDIPEFADLFLKKQVDLRGLDKEVLELIEDIDEKIYTNIVNDEHMVNPNYVKQIRKKIIEIFKKCPEYEKYMPNIRLGVTEIYVASHSNLRYLKPEYLVASSPVRCTRDGLYVLTLSVKFYDVPLLGGLNDFKTELHNGIHSILSPPIRSRSRCQKVRNVRTEKRNELLNTPPKPYQSGAPDGLPTTPNDPESAPLPEKLNKDEVVTCLKTLLMPLFLAYRKSKTKKLSMHTSRAKYDQFIKILNEVWELLSNRKELALFYNKVRQAIIEDAGEALIKADSINNACINETKPEVNMALTCRMAIKAVYGSKDCSSSERELLVELYECFGLPHRDRKWIMVSGAKNSKNTNTVQKHLCSITNAKAEAEEIPEFDALFSDEQIVLRGLDKKILELIEDIDEKIYTNIVNDKHMVYPNYVKQISKKIIEIFNQYPLYKQYMRHIKLSVTEEYVSPDTKIEPGYLVEAESLRHKKGDESHVLTLSVKFDDVPLSEDLTSLKRDLWQGINGILSPSLITRLKNDTATWNRAVIRRNLKKQRTAEPLLPESTPDSPITLDSQSTTKKSTPSTKRKSTATRKKVTATKRKSTATLTPTEATAPKQAKSPSPTNEVNVSQFCA